MRIDNPAVDQDRTANGKYSSMIRFARVAQATQLFELSSDPMETKIACPTKI